jgi:hypothetical protein
VDGHRGEPRGAAHARAFARYAEIARETSNPQAEHLTQGRKLAESSDPVSLFRYEVYDADVARKGKKWRDAATTYGKACVHER